MLFGTKCIYEEYVGGAADIHILQRFPTCMQASEVANNVRKSKTCPTRSFEKTAYLLRKMAHALPQVNATQVVED